MPKAALFFAILILAFTTRGVRADEAIAALPPPRFADVSYGGHPGQRLDIYLPDGATAPVPFVMFIHGGGWFGGDKRKNFERIRSRFADAGLGVASINYRFLADAKKENIWPPVLAPLHDAARALQTIRFRAKEFRLDPTRVVLMGESAGAFTALWLGLGDDRADPRSADPIARQSTRVAAIGVNAAQTSLDPEQMRAWVGPELTYGPAAFGLPNNPAGFAEFVRRREEFMPWIAKLSPAALLSRDDPPLFLLYGNGLTPTEPLTPYYTHSPRFGIGFKAEADRIGVTCQLTYPGLADASGQDTTTFLINTLKAAR